jgi:RNA polymerase sigma-70 factor (ECF subfamily)
VFNVCLNYLQNRHDAEEVTQDVFVKVHEQLDNFEGRAQIKTWIYRIAINKSLDFLKAQKRQKRFGFHIPILVAGNSALPPLSTFDHPGILMEDEESLKGIFENINTLPTNQKTALLLKSIENLTQQEIADVMKISIKAVESLLSRARSNLKQKSNMTKG